MADNTIVDALADKAIEIVELAKEHTANGRHSEATLCLQTVAEMTYQVHRIEDHITPGMANNTVYNFTAPPKDMY